MDGMKLFYFPALPLMAAPIPGLRPSKEGGPDPRLSSILSPPPVGFRHKIIQNSWSMANKIDMVDSIKTKGQMVPNVVNSVEPATIGTFIGPSWCVEPGQSRWLAMYHLGLATQKAIVIARFPRDSEKFKEFDDYERTEITSKSQLYAYYPDESPSLPTEGRISSLPILCHRAKQILDLLPD